MGRTNCVKRVCPSLTELYIFVTFLWALLVGLDDKTCYVFCSTRFLFSIQYKESSDNYYTILIPIGYVWCLNRCWDVYFWVADKKNRCILLSKNWTVRNRELLCTLFSTWKLSGPRRPCSALVQPLVPSRKEDKNRTITRRILLTQTTSSVVFRRGDPKRNKESIFYIWNGGNTDNEIDIFTSPDVKWSFMANFMYKQDILQHGSSLVTK